MLSFKSLINAQTTQTDPVKEWVWWTALTGRITEDNNKIDSSVSHTAL